MGIIETGTSWEESRNKQVLPSSSVSRFTVTDQASEWHFFNHGALFAFAGLMFPKEDPVADWYHQQPAGMQVIRHPFTKPVLSGLDAPSGFGSLSWDHVVMGVRHEFWPSLWQFLGGVVTLDAKERRYCQLFSGELDVIDQPSRQ